MKFHLDENVDRAIALGLTRRGIEVTTVDDAGLRGADDATQLQHAFAEQRVLVTNDADFLRLHRQGIRHAGIAYFADRSDPPARAASRSRASR